VAARARERRAVAPRRGRREAAAPRRGEEEWRARAGRDRPVCSRPSPPGDDRRQVAVSAWRATAGALGRAAVAAITGAGAQSSNRSDVRPVGPTCVCKAVGGGGGVDSCGARRSLMACPTAPGGAT